MKGGLFGSLALGAVPGLIGGAAVVVTLAVVAVLSRFVDLSVFSLNLITMLGGVVLTQCRNVLRGDRLLVDMTTGVSRIESDKGQVQVLFDQSGQGCGSPAPGPKWAAPPSARSSSRRRSAELSLTNGPQPPILGA